MREGAAPTEIERKFLVVAHDPGVLGEGDDILQRYLRTGDPEVRVRRRAGAFTVTVKRGGGLEREEIEGPVDQGLGDALLDAAPVGVRKRRHVRGRWEVDVYLGRFDGLVVAECELQHTDEELPEPPAGLTLGRELTEDRRFSNARLAELDEKEAAELVRELAGGG